MGYDLKDYVEVKDRIAQFKKDYPDGRLTSDIIPSGFEGYVTVKAYAYRTPDDPTPGSGLAWEPVPGKTNFTKDSELQNAETSAWGRAIVAALIADASGGVASADEVRNRQAGGSEATPSPTSHVGSYVVAGKCPSCKSDVWDNNNDHETDSKKPRWRCKNKDCQGGAAKKNGNGNWGWASWDINPWEVGVPVRTDFDAAEPPYREDDPGRPF
jgi:hypothetical protein